MHMKTAPTGAVFDGALPASRGAMNGGGFDLRPVSNIEVEITMRYAGE